MRPRVFPAEDPFLRQPPPFDDRASMRPRVFPAEDSIPVLKIAQLAELQ